MQRELAIQRIAIKILAGLLANPENSHPDYERIAEMAISYATALYDKFENQFTSLV